MMSLGLIADAVLKGTALLLVVFALAYVLKRAPAATRHLAWAVGLAGVLALPFLSNTMPWRLSVLPAAAAPVASVTAIDLAVVSDDPLLPALDQTRPIASPVASRAAVSRPDASAQASPVELERGLSWPSAATLIALLPTLWLIGVAVLLLRLVIGVAAIQVIARRAESSRDPAWLDALARAKTELGVDRPVRLVVSDSAAMPFTAGVVRHVIVLPESSNEWDAERRHAVLLHELAHIRRRDVLAHVVAQVACATYWFHPLVWMAARRLRAECERACDDLVLGTGTRASDYAEHLLSIVRSAARRWTPAVALPMARRSEFEGRLLAILESTGRPRAVTRAASATIVAMVTVTVIPLAALAPGAANHATVFAQTALYASPPAPVGSADANADEASALRVPSIDSVASRQGVAQGPAEIRTAASDEGVAIVLDPTSPARPRFQTPASPVAALVATLRDPDADVRKAAARSLATYQDTTALRALARALGEDPDPTVRRTAAWALGEMENPLAIPALSQALSSDDDPAVRAMAASALGEIEDAAAVGALGDAVANDTEPAVRKAAIEALGEIEDPRAIEPLRPALSDSSAEIRAEAIRALGEIEDARAIDMLAPVLQSDPDPRIRQLAAWALGEIEDSRAVEPLTAALSDSDRDVRIRVVRALAEIEDTRAVQPLLAVLSDQDAEIRKYAAYALGEIEDARAVESLANVLRNDADADVRAVAASALGEIEDRRAAPALAAALSDASVEVRRRAAYAFSDLDELNHAPAELVRALQDSDAQVRLRVLRALAEIEDPATVSAIQPMLRDEMTEIRRAAIRALGEIHDPASYEVLVAALQDEDPEVRRLAARALGRRN